MNEDEDHTEADGRWKQRDEDERRETSVARTKPEGRAQHCSFPNSCVPAVCKLNG